MKLRNDSKQRIQKKIMKGNKKKGEQRSDLRSDVKKIYHLANLNFLYFWLRFSISPSWPIRPDTHQTIHPQALNYFSTHTPEMMFRKPDKQIRNQRLLADHLCDQSEWSLAQTHDTPPHLTDSLRTSRAVIRQRQMVPPGRDNLGMK